MFMFIKLLIFTSFLYFSSCIQCKTGSLPPATTTNSVCYFPLSSDSFYKAELSCNDLDVYHLPSLTNEEENHQFGIIASAYFSSELVWIGLDSRLEWLDGTTINYNKLIPFTIPPLPGLDCLAFNISTASWVCHNCSDSLPYICQQRDTTDPVVSMLSCPLKAKFATHLKPNDVDITVGSQCSSWQIAAMVVLQNADSAPQYLKVIANFVSNSILHCSPSSILTVFTPGSAANLTNPRSTPVTQAGLNNLFHNLMPQEVLLSDPTMAPSVMDSVFNQMFTYPPFTLPIDVGGFVYIFTDILCQYLCNDEFMKNQQEYIDNLTLFGYNIRFIHLGDEHEQNCLSDVFERCGDYNPAICDRIQASNTSIPDGPNVDFCFSQSMDAGDPPGLSTTWEIVIIVITIVFALLILMCACWRLYFRYKQLSSMWKAFWIKQKNEKETSQTVIHLGDRTAGKVQNYYHNVDGKVVEVDDWEIKIDDLEILENELLGSGAFGNVYKANLRGEIPVVKKFGDELKLGLRKNGSEEFMVAVKQLPIHANNDAILDFENEIEFMKTLGYHAHVVSLLGAITVIHKPLIVIENCENGDLLTYLRNHEEQFGTSLKYKDLYSISWQISDGMNYLSSNNLIHRDIAARNILLTKSMVAKISDFGLCRLVDSSLYTAKGGRLPIKWMAIESLKYYQYSVKSDIWSFGVLLYELFSFGETPYQTVQPNEMPKYLEEGNRLEQPKLCTDQVYEMMKKCWSTHPEDRPAIEELRDFIASLLDVDSETYGYITVDELQNSNEIIQEED